MAFNCGLWQIKYYNNMIERREVKSCCAAKSVIFFLKKAVRKSQVPMFKEKGYNISEFYEKAGIFYLNNGGLIVQGPFGGTSLTIQCNAPDCVQKINQFEINLKEILEKS